MALIAVTVAKKAAIMAAKHVNRKHPGIWWKITAGVIVATLLAGMLLVYVAATVIAPLFAGGISETCAAEPLASEGDELHDGHGSGGGEFSTAGTPWPKEDSATVVYPAPSPVLTSPFGYRPPFLVNGVLTPGYHNGLDFGQAHGSPVLSMADGIVAGAYAGNSLYGSHVAVKHRIGGKNYTSVYGHIIGTSIKVKQGDTVKAGQQIASIGSEGMSTAPHLHFVLTAGDYSAQASEPGYTGGAGNSIDPAAFLRTQGAGKASGGLGGDDFSGVEEPEDMACSDSEGMEGDGFTAWGGHENGAIPSALLSSIAFAGEKKLVSQAARDLEGLNGEFKARFGKDLVVLRAYENGGSSAFGWARAVELRIAFGTPEYTFLEANAAKFGWAQPAIYQQGGSAASAGIWGWKGSTNVPPAATPDAEQARAIAKRILEDQYRWGSADYKCLVQLWERESNWNPLADNPTSDAYGIPQALPGSKMASEGSDWRTNPETQIRWGLKYIKERYGSPCVAWDHSERVNWY